MPRHIMIDIETWDTTPTAVIRAIAIVGFDLNADPFIFDGDCTSVIDCRRTVDEQIQAGRTVDPETVVWWTKQQPLDDLLLQTRTVTNVEVFEPHSLKSVVENVLEELYGLRDPNARIWCRGHFDIAILVNLLAAHGQPIPWRYSQVRDVRTLDEITPPIKAAMPHHPLADCLAQIGHVCKAIASRREALHIDEDAVAGAQAAHA